MAKKVRAHGTQASYRAGCRCDECRAGNTIRCRNLRQKRVQTVQKSGVPRGIPHGASCYNNWGCRCDVCVAATQEKNGEYRANVVRAGKVDHTRGGVLIDCPCQSCRSQAPKRARERVQAKQSALLDAASNHGKPWTSAELQLIVDHRQPDEELARVLGRTLFAIRLARRRAITDPRRASLLEGGRK